MNDRKIFVMYPEAKRELIQEFVKRKCVSRKHFLNSMNAEKYIVILVSYVFQHWIEPPQACNTDRGAIFASIGLKYSCCIFAVNSVYNNTL